MAKVPVISVLVLLWAVPASAQQFTEHVQEAQQENPDLMKIGVSLGGSLATGNTRNFSLVGGATFELHRDANVVAAEVRGQYGQASVRQDDGTFSDFETNAENIAGRVRYDRFFTASDAAFLSFGARRDRFAGLDSRLQLQVGYLREFFDLGGEGKHRLWGEIGYDFTHDNFDPDPLVDPMTMMTLPGDASVHSGRLFIGYVNHLNDAITFDTGAELLVNVQEPSDTRLNWLSKVTSTLAAGLSVALAFELHWDHEPVQGHDSLDTLTTLNLVLAYEDPASE